MSNDQRNPKPEYRTLRRSGTALSSFGFQYSFGFRDSSSDLETAGHEEPLRHFAVRWVDEPGPTPPQPPFRLRQGSGGQVGHLLPHRGVRVYRASQELARSAGFIPQERRPRRPALGNRDALSPTNLPEDSSPRSYRRSPRDGKHIHRGRRQGWGGTVHGRRALFRFACIGIIKPVE